MSPDKRFCSVITFLSWSGTHPLLNSGVFVLHLPLLHGRINHQLIQLKKQVARTEMKTKLGVCAETMHPVRREEQQCRQSASERLTAACAQPPVT